MKNQQQKGKHLTLPERVEIYRLKKEGCSNREIARQIHRHHSVVDRELARNSVPFNIGDYTPVEAQIRSQKRALKQRQKAPLKNPKVFLYVRDKLREKRTPEQISGRIGIDHPGESISAETIYKQIYGAMRKDKLWQYLPRSHKRRKRKKPAKGDWQQQAEIKGKISIELRPTRVNIRKQAGHWETDLMESKRGISSNVSAHIERKTRFTKLEKLSNKKAQTKQKSMHKTLKVLQSLSKSKRPIVKTMTYDNGSENVKHQLLSKKLNIDSYFCQPYHSWEKGSVENTIGRVRRFFPKGTDLSKISHKQIQQVENWLNNTPMKCLDWRTPNEAMELEVNKYKFREYRKVLDQSGAFPD